jgi:hypothetical protein
MLPRCRFHALAEGADFAARDATALRVDAVVTPPPIVAPKPRPTPALEPEDPRLEGALCGCATALRLLDVFGPIERFVWCQWASA